MERTPGRGRVATRARRADRGDFGFTLTEAIVATLVATIAVIGLAYSLSQGRGLIDRFEVARVALGAAQARMELLSVLDPAAPELALGGHPAAPLPFTFRGQTVGSEHWRVEAIDDPSTSDPADLRRVTVSVSFRSGTLVDSLSLARVFRP